jgi:AAA ATPase domain
MNNIIELKFKSIADDLYDVEFSAGIEGKSTEVTLCAKVPVFDPSPYRRYQGACQRFYHCNTRIVLEYLGTFSKEDLDESAADLLHKFNSWAASPQFTEIAQAIAARSENLQVTISTECADLRRLPFHRLNLFPANTEAIFSGIEAKRLERTRHPDKIRILVILGDKTGIDIDADRRAIEDYCKKDAEVVFLAQPDRNKLTAALADPKGWDIIFFSGHSCTEGDKTGRIFINATDSLTMDELKDVLQPAIEHRVQIAIFNSCDGLGITPVLEKLNIDRLIVMREPIPDLIAQEFLKSFLKAFTGGARFDDAVKAARQQLTTFEDRYPYVSWLPVVIQNRLVSSPTWQSLGKIRSPYKGLEAFTQADAGNFYGREETIERYAKLVAAAPLVPIIGASGSGKSSLVQAGLIPYLKQDPASDWQILTMRPGRNPFDALAKAIFNAERADLQTIELDVDLASDRYLLTQKLAQIRIPQHRILLFIDQFEELFTQSDDEAARQVFLQSLADAVSNAPNFVLVFTLRNDFLPTLQSDRQDHDFRQVLEQYGLQSIGSMSRDKLEAAITKPVEKLGVEFESGLVDRLMKDVGTVDSSLPLLQLVLDLLWKNVQKRQLTHECYDTIGGKDGMKTVLIKLADDVYDGFVKQGKVKEFKQVFLRLVTIGNANTPNTRRIDTRADIGEDNWREIVLKLVDKRLLKTDLDEQGKEIVEVIHETLIQSWQQLGNWIEQHRHDLERIAEIELAAIKWNRNQRSKHHLLHGKELKDARKFWKNREDLFVNFSGKSNVFINASSEKQLLDRSVLILVQTLIISPWILIGYNLFVLFIHPKTDSYPTEQPTIKIPY